MPEPTFTDDQGNVYTASQIRSAVQKMSQDEAGQGSLGGLATDQSNAVTPTSAPAAQAGVAPGTADTSDVDKMVAEATKEKPAPQRELNPMHFGQFFKDNIAAPTLGTGYVTGKRPMNLLDYATDVASSLGGEDIGKRNAAIIKANKGDALEGLKAAHLGEQIKQERATAAKAQAGTSKTGLETNALLDTAISDTFENYDSDLWSKHVKELAKQNGVEIPASSLEMIDRAMQKMHEVGATRVSDVISAPAGTYPPEVVNRVKHLSALVNKHAEDSANRQAEEQQRLAAGALSGQKALDVTQQAKDRATRVQQGAIRTAAAPNVQAAQEQGIVPSVIPGAGDEATPTTPEQLQGVKATRSTTAAKAAAERAQTTNAQTVEDNLGVLERYYSDPQFDDAIKSLPAAPGKGVIGGTVGRGQAAASEKLTFPAKLRAGDAGAQYLDSATQTIIPRIRADAMGTSGLRINTKEIDLLGKEAQRIATGNATQQEAAAHKARALNLVKQVRAQLASERQGGAGTGVGQTFQHPSGATITRTK